MGWLDDLTARAQQTVSNAENNIDGYLKSVVSFSPVKIGSPQGGNLSAADIAAGARGTPPGGGAVVPPAATAAQLNNATQASGFSLGGMALSLPMLAIIGVGVYFLLGKKGRGI